MGTVKGSHNIKMVIRTPNQILGNNGSKRYKKMKQNRRRNKKTLGKRIIIVK